MKYVVFIICFSLSCAQSRTQSRSPGTPRNPSQGADPDPTQPIPNVPISSSQVFFLKPGHDTLSWRFQLIRQARQSLRIQTFAWKGDDSGFHLAREVIAAKNRGVAVTVNIDDMSMFFKESQYIYHYLMQNGIIVEGFQPPNIQFLDRLDLLLNPNSNVMAGLFNYIKDKDLRYHDKFMIVDAEDPAQAVVMMGGTNFGNEYYDITGGDPLKNWTDQDVLVRDPNIVQQMVQAFNSNRQEMAIGDGRKPISSILQNSVLAPEIAKVLSGNIVSKLDLKRDRWDEVKRLSTMPTLIPQWEAAQAAFIHHRPRNKQFTGEKAYLDMITSARSEILLANSYFIPSDPMILALLDAAKRGVKVKILTNAAEVTDSPPVVIVGRMSYDNIVNTSAAAGNMIEIYEWGGEPILKNGQGLAHQKYGVFDNTTAFVGSYNLDPRSELKNSETILKFSAPLTVGQLRSQYLAEIAPKFATLVTPEKAKAYKVAQNGMEFIKREFLIMFKTFL
jgi:putative cardiolipin synthase